MRTLTNKLNERINTLSTEDYQLILYCALLIISFLLDYIHCQLIANYYGCLVADLQYYDRGILLILLSIAFGVVNLVLSYKICNLVNHVRVEITITNGFITSIKGIKRLLLYPAQLILFISVCSIMYDLFY